MAKAVAVADEQSTGMERLKSQPQKLMEFLKDVRAEMRKVITPSRAEVKSTTTVVIIAVFIFGLFFFIVDSIFSYGLDRLLKQLGGLQQ